MEDDSLRVSKNYYWTKSTGKFWDERSGDLFSDESYEAIVKVFEDRQFTWFLDVAKDLAKEDARLMGYVALSVAVAHIEAIEQYRRGEAVQTSWRLFNSSAKRIFPRPMHKAIRPLWEDVRNGLLHTGFTSNKTYINYKIGVPLKLNDGELHINPKKFIDCVIDDFKKYVEELKADPESDTSKKFRDLWKKRWDEG